MRSVRSAEQRLHWNLQRLGDGRHLVIGDGPIPALDLRNLRLIEVNPLTCETARHVLLRDLWIRSHAQALDGFTSDVASVLFVRHGALEGALILILFGLGIILVGNKNAVHQKMTAPSKKLTILCVDDHTLVGEALARVFTTAGYHVERADDGLMAWEKLSANLTGFDVLITDHEMPQLDGLQLVELLREADYPGRIIVYSGSLSEETRAAYHRHAVDAIVVKGPDSARLLAIVEAFHGEMPHGEQRSRPHPK